MKRLAWVVGWLLLCGCPPVGCGGAPDTSDGGAGGVGGGNVPSGGGGGGGNVPTGGGSGGGGGSVTIDFDASFPLPDASLFVANWVDDGGVLVGCEVEATAGGTPADCTPHSAGCQQASDCASGLCLELAGGSICTVECGGASACPPGWTCQTRWTGAGQQGFCVPAGRAP
jgi:hypothetical protein